MNLQARVKKLGLTLPPPPAAAADYRVINESHSTLYVSGQLPKTDDGQLLAVGKVGGAVDLDTAKACARQCVLNALSAIAVELGEDFEQRFEQIARVRVFVASTPDFTDQHLVADAASGLLHEVLGQAGRHARSAVGCVSLPLDAPVEIEMIIELLDDHLESD